VAHVSPVCWQNEPLWQLPLGEQNCEQHCDAIVHASPSTLQEFGVGKVAQVPVAPPSRSHMPLQHWMPLVQPWPSCAQTTTHEFPLQVPLQQSLAWMQPAPGCKQEAESVGNGLASAMPPEEPLLDPLPDEAPLEAPLPDAPLDAPLPPPLLDEAPLELAPLLPLLDVVASPEPSTRVASPAEPSSPLPEEPPEASEPPSDALPSLESDWVAPLLPHPAAATAAATMAMRAKVEHRDLIRIAAPSILGFGSRALENRSAPFTFRPTATGDNWSLE
jgi:hypothetical protein